MKPAFTTLYDFLSMQGHGPYVWAAYAMSLVVIALLILVPIVRKSKLLSQIKRQQHNKSQRHQTIASSKSLQETVSPTNNIDE